MFGTLSLSLVLLLLKQQAMASEDWVIPEDVRKAVDESKNLPLGMRMRVVTEPLLGMSYLVDAAGEGVAPDPDPPVRYDAFDCLTFVEEAMALSISSDVNSTADFRNQIRYIDQEMLYDKRRHFMLSQWIPHNIEQGLLQDITSELGESHLVTKSISPMVWARWKGRHKFYFEQERFPSGSWTLTVLSLDAAVAAVENLPEGALLLVVRKERSYQPVMITHLGFVVYKEGIPWIRHATKMGGGLVRDDRLPWYFEHLQWFSNWPIEGIMVLMPQEQGPRRNGP